MGAKKRALTPTACEMPGCGYDRIVQRHRILPGSEGGKYTSGNVIALCPNHHGEADRGWIERPHLLAIVQTRLMLDEVRSDISDDV